MYSNVILFSVSTEITNFGRIIMVTLAEVLIDNKYNFQDADTKVYKKYKAGVRLYLNNLIK